MIDGSLDFVNDEKTSKEDVLNNLANYAEDNYEEYLDNYPHDFQDKLVEVFAANSHYDFNTPKVKSHII